MCVRVAVGVVTTGVVYFLVVEVALHKPQALLSAVGLLVYVIVFYVTSHDPAQVFFFLFFFPDIRVMVDWA